MAEYYIEVINLDFDDDSTADPIRYIFEGIQNLDRLKEQGYTVASAQQAERSKAFSFTPPKVRIPINWLIIDGENRSQITNDKSDGTLSSSGITDSNFSNNTVKTIKEQVNWLEKYIFNGTGGTQFRLYGGNFSDPNGDGTDEGTPVVISNIRLPQNVNELNAPEASIELQLADAV